MYIILSLLNLLVITLEVVLKSALGHNVCECRSSLQDNIDDVLIILRSIW